jgi:uncharacterized RDD family membrane protein YckC
MSEQDPQVPAQEPPAPGTPPPPEQPAQPAWAAQGPSGPRASFGRRLVAYLIDYAILLVVYGVVYAIGDQNLATVVSIAFGLAYFTYFEGGPKGQTPGKMALGIRVVDFGAGGPIGYGRGAIRYVGRLVSGIVCLLGYLWMLWDKEKQTWHDKFANSVVVPEQYYPVNR